jgi:D-alanyl-D-alanine carboxypeptidase (penicillin-binding protein 5/6)
VGTLVTPAEVAPQPTTESGTASGAAVAGRPVQAKPNGPSRVLSVAAAASVAIVLAAAPLMLLTIQRRRRATTGRPPDPAQP